MRLRTSVYYVLAVILGIALLYFLGCEKTETPASPVSKSPAITEPPTANQPKQPAEQKPAPAPISDIEKGKEVYLAYCAGCHGERGDGNSAMAGALNPKPRNFTNKKEWLTYGDDEKTISVIKNGGPAVLNRQSAMPPYQGMLTEVEIKSVLAYVKSLAK